MGMDYSSASLLVGSFLPSNAKSSGSFAHSSESKTSWTNFSVSYSSIYNWISKSNNLKAAIAGRSYNYYTIGSDVSLGGTSADLSVGASEVYSKTASESSSTDVWKLATDS